MIINYINLFVLFHTYCTALIQRSLLMLGLPVLHVVQNQLRSLFRRMLSSESLDEVSLGIHKVEVNAMIDKIVLAGLDVLWCAEVDTVLLAKILNLVVCSSQANELGVKFGEVSLEGLGVVTFGIAGDEDGQQFGCGLLFDEI